MNKMIKVTLKATDNVSKDIKVLYKGQELTALTTAITLVLINNDADQDKLIYELLKAKH